MWGKETIAWPGASPGRLRQSASSMPLTVRCRAADDLRVGDLVQDVGVDQAKDLARQVLRELGDEDQAEPALAAALGDPRHLLEQDRHLLDALGGEELVRLLDDEQDAATGGAGLPVSRARARTPRTRRPARPARRAADRRSRCWTARTCRCRRGRPPRPEPGRIRSLVDAGAGRRAGDVEDLQAVQPRQLAEQRAPGNRELRDAGRRARRCLRASLPAS